MLLRCPVCGMREEDEFVYGGDAAAVRPENPDALSDVEWTAFVYLRHNPKGGHREFWFHRFGCRRWLIVERNTVTHKVGAIVESASSNKDGVG